jgi:hypothetical protein
MNTARIFALALLTASACKPSMAEDLDKFCIVVGEVARDTSLDTQAKLAKIAARTNEYVQPDIPGEADTWKKLHEAPLDQKHAVLSDIAVTSEKKEWKCSLYEKLIAMARAEEALRVEKEKAASAPPDAGVAPDSGAAPTSEEPKKKSKKDKRKKKKRRSK